MQDKISVVIPCYKVENHIEKVVESIDDFVSSIILVNDASPDNTATTIASIKEKNKKVTILTHETNQGVGGAMITGFKEALRQNADIVIKIDGDGQMDCSQIEKMVKILQTSDCNFCKGNRFFDRKQLKNMPAIRRFGNIGLSFLIKMASGYWNIADPSNGFLCISSKVLQRIDFSRVSKRFFFECSLLIESFYAGAKIYDFPMPAIYADEKSNLSIWKTLITFPPKLFVAYLRRIILQYYFYDFNICSLYYLFGNIFFGFGLIFGIIKWIQYAMIDIPAPTGTIILALVTLILGFQMLLAAIQFDINSKNPFEIKNL